jgi:hypothetical protein
MLLGSALGLAYAMIINPPYWGMFRNLPSDVAGLTFFSWIFFTFIGGIAGAFVGVLIFDFILSRKSQRGEDIEN